MTYEKLSADDITQLEFQAGKRATEIIDTLLQKIDEINDAAEALEARVKALEDAQAPDESEGADT